MLYQRHWFVKEVVYWRTYASYVWFLLLFPPGISVYIFLVNASLLYPYSWLTDWLSSLFSSGTVVSAALIAFSSLAVAICRTFFYTVSSTVYPNRLSLIVAMFKPSYICHIILHMFVGAFTMYNFSGLMGSQYSSLVVPCKDDAFCLNEYHLFLVMFGPFLGFLYGSAFFLYGENVISFPAIQPLKFFQVKSRILPSLVVAFRTTFFHTAYFYVFYFFFGCILRSQFVAALNLHGSLVHMDSLFNMINLSHFWLSWVSGAFIYHLWTFAGYLFKIYFAEVFHFPIESSLAVQQDTCLEKILAHQSDLRVCYHGYQDLCYLAENSAGRRQQLFTLSQPGGHPYNWLAVLNQCLSMIDSKTTKLQETLLNGGTDTSHKTGDGKPVNPQSSFLYTTSVQDNSLVFRTPRSAGRETSLSSEERDSLTNLSHSGDMSGFNRSYAPSRRPPIRSDDSAAEAPRSDSKAFPRTTPFSKLRDKLFPKSLFETWPESANRLLFVNCQLHIWAVEAVSSLVAYSFHEDSFGVVQNHLSQIIVSLLSLNNALDKHHKRLQLNFESTNASQNSIVLQSSSSVPQLRRDLHATVKTSLHRIVAVFGNHLKGISLSPEYRKQLQQLMNYQE